MKSRFRIQPEMMRIEFMAPEEFKRRGNIRVDVQQEVHARACTGGSIALTESSLHVLSGKLPDALQFTASIRVTKPHALVMLKLLALDDRYRNIRGPEEARHDREEARTHAADIVAIVSAQFDLEQFKADFERQFHLDAALALRVFRILGSYFRETHRGFWFMRNPLSPTSRLIAMRDAKSVQKSRGHTA